MDGAAACWKCCVDCRTVHLLVSAHCLRMCMPCQGQAPIVASCLSQVVYQQQPQSLAHCKQGGVRVVGLVGRMVADWAGRRGKRAGVRW